MHVCTDNIYFVSTCFKPCTVMTLLRIHKIISVHRKIISDHSKILSDQSKILSDQSKIISDHSEILSDQSKIIDSRVGYGLEMHVTHVTNQLI